MEVSKKTWAAAFAWAALVLVAEHDTVAASLPGTWIIGLAPLALAILLAVFERESAELEALDVEALAWEQPMQPPRWRSGDGKAIPVQSPGANWRPRPVTA